MGWGGEQASVEYSVLEENAAAQAARSERERAPCLFRESVSKGVDCSTELGVLSDVDKCREACLWEG